MVVSLSTNSIQQEIDSINAALRARGVFTHSGYDFRELQNHIRERSTRHNLLRQFDPDGDLPKAEKAFWLCGYDADGDLLYTQAVQLLDLRNSSVSEFIAANQHYYLPASPSVDKSSVRTVPGPKASRLTGWIVYHGEMWLHASLRDRGVANLVVRLGVLRATTEWDPDAIFGLMNWSLACSGFNNRIGYTHCEPMAVVWDRRAKKKEHQVWTVYVEREDVQFMLEMPTVAFSGYLSRDFK